MAPPVKVEVDRVQNAAFGLADELPSGSGDWHQHRFHQLLYASRGSLRLEAEGQEWLLPPQRAAWIGAGILHRVAVRQPVSLRTVYLSATLATADFCRVFSVTPLAREMILYSMRWGPDGVFGAQAERYFAALASLAEEWALAALPYGLPLAQSPELQRALFYTQAHLADPLQVEDVAKNAGLSVRTLARRCRAELNLSWSGYLANARMLRAMERLAAPGARVTEVALEVGFESLAAFSRSFLAFTGESPKNYRAKVAARPNNP